ncbi:MAG: DUF2007 domain-containing protein [Myxococcota bacterium]
MSERDVRIAEFSSRAEAEIARARLESWGIEARVSTDDVGGAYPQLQADGVYLSVSGDDAERASEILSQPEEAPEDAPGDTSAAQERVRDLNRPRPRLLRSFWVEALVLLLLGGALGFAIGASRTFEANHHAGVRTDTLELDRNQDGQVDQWHVYQGTEPVYSRTDRNFDGKPDRWDFYRGGSVTRSEIDDDFDGDADGWMSFQAGNLSEASFDADHNGARDLTTTFEFGVPVSSRFHPNEGPLEREEVYIEGVLREVYAVDANGERTLIRSYDEVGREISGQR